MALTKTEINRLRPGGRRFIWDTDLRGFGVRITEGAVSYVVDFRVGGKRRRVSLGGVGIMSLEQARHAAAGILLAARTGTDRTARDQTGSVTFGAVWHRLQTEVDEKTLAPATIASYRERIKPILAALGKRDITAISVADVKSLVYGLNGDRNRSYAVALIKKVFNYGKELRLLADSYRNPAIDVPTKRGPKRNRALTLEVLQKFGAALAEMEAEGKVSPWLANLFRLALLCGLRPGEARTIEWADVDFPNRRMTVQGKTGRRPIWLADEALEVLKATPRVEGCKFVFPGRRFGRPIVALHKALRSVQARAGIEPFAPYSLRHTAATGALTRGVDLAAVQALLGHANVATTAGYLHSDEARRKTAAEQAAAFGGTVVPLKRGGRPVV
jgi:integrase